MAMKISYSVVDDHGNFNPITFEITDEEDVLLGTISATDERQAWDKAHFMVNDYVMGDV